LQATYPPGSYISSPAASQQAQPAPGGTDFVTITTWNQQGFSTIMTLPAGWSTTPKSYDDQGFLITAAPNVASGDDASTVPLAQSSNPTATAYAAAAQAKAAGGHGHVLLAWMFVLFCAFISAALLL